MSKKIKVLVVPSDRTGVGKFRSVSPHVTLERNYPDEFHVDIDYNPQLNNDAWLKQYDIIHYHRTLGPYELMPQTLERIKNLGITTIMDLDDYWAPGKHHPAYLIIKNAKMDEKILNNIKVAENVTTTTSEFAKEIGKYNKNVHVLANAIDPTEKQYIPNPEPSDRVRIGWLGGSSHLEDLKLLKGMVGKIKSDGLIDKVQFVLCGYDLRGKVTMIDPKTGQQKQRDIMPKESVWYQYEKIFTDDYKTVSEEYKNHLLRFKNEEFKDVMNEPYRRVWTKPVTSYATNYNLFDVSLAPLEEHIFNRVKSQLKVIEAGFHKKALIAQDFGPYTIDLKPMFTKGDKKEGPVMTDDGNAILVPSIKNHKDWYKSVKKVIQNPELITEMSERLHNTVKDTYSIDAVTAQRRDLYLNLLAEKKNVELEVASK